MSAPLTWMAALALPLATLPAAAAQWALEGNLASRTEVNDNPGLATRPDGVVVTQSLSAAFIAARQTETSRSGLDLALAAYRATRASDPSRVDTRVGFSQSWTDVVDGLSLNLSQARNSTFDTRQGAVDVALGRGQRRTTALQAVWSRTIDERWSVNTSLAATRTGYGATLPAAIDFQNATLAADATWRLGPIDSLRLRLGHADFRTLGDDARGSGSRSGTQDAGVGWQRQLDELSSMSLNLGLYTTRRAARQDVRVCPQPVDLCQRGLVAPVVVQAQGRRTERGLQYAASYRRQLDEVSDIALSASRAQSPSGSGLVLLGDTLSLVANRSLSETLNGSFTMSHSRTVYRGVVDPPKPGYQRMSLSLSRQLTDNLGLQAGWDWSRSFEARSGVSARSNSVSVTLKYDGPKMFATR